MTPLGKTTDWTIIALLSFICIMSISFVIWYGGFVINDWNEVIKTIPALAVFVRLSLSVIDYELAKNSEPNEVD